MRKELIDAKAMLAELTDARADKILEKQTIETPISVRAIQGGQFESNRRKF